MKIIISYEIDFVTIKIGFLKRNEDVDFKN